MNTESNDTGAKDGGFSKIAPLFGTTGGSTPPPSDSSQNQKSKSLEYAPTLPSSEEIAKMTEPDGAAADTFAKEGIILEPLKKDTSVRDPLFAARILDQERGAVIDLNTEGKIPLPSPTPVKQDVEESAPRIRTFQSDVAETLKKQKTSVIQMVLAEQKKKYTTAEEASPKQPKNIALIIVSLTLVFIGVSISGFAAWRYVQTQQEEAEQTKNLSGIPSLIITEEKKGIDITGLTRDRIARAISGEINSVNIRLDTIEQIYLVRDVTNAADSSLTPPSIQALVQTSEFWNALESGMPEALLRALAQDFFIGVRSFNGNQPFIILRADYFESAFAGMLRWEQSLARDVLPLFGTRTTPELVTRPFVDVVIRNQDYRALRDEEGNIVLLYIFHDKNTVVIATADETIKEVIDRLNRSVQGVQ